MPAASIGGACMLCPGQGGIWVAPEVSGTGVCQLPVTGWVRLPHTQTVSLTPDREDPSEIRTDSTSGQRVKVCPGQTSWSVDVTSILCTTNWLWCYLFPKTVDTCGSGIGEHLDVTTQVSQFFYLSALGVAPDGDVDRESGGVYFYGFPNIGDFGWDNDDNDPISTDWSIDITNGPWFEPATPVTCNLEYVNPTS